MQNTTSSLRTADFHRYGRDPLSAEDLGQGSDDAKAGTIMAIAQNIAAAYETDMNSGFHRAQV
jgi:hypothetical protein